VWKRSYGRPTKAPPDERGGNRHGRPKTTAPHPDSTDCVEKLSSRIRTEILIVKDPVIRNKWLYSYLEK
jgi:hypothetical protein